METQTQATPNTQPYPQLISGLGGWLVLVQIGLYSTMFLLMLKLISILSIFGDGSWELFTDKSSIIYHALWQPLILFELIYNLLLFAFSIFILVCFYSKKKILPRLMIFYFVVSVLFVLIDYILFMQIPIARELDSFNYIKEIVRGVFTCMIWIPYFIRSIRVKNTFIH